MGRVLDRRAPLAALLAGAAALAGCAGGPATPDDAHKALAQAVAARDAGRLYDALDLDTRWSWMSIQRAEREAYDIILSNYPDGAERQHLLRRCEPGALAESARELFGKQVDAATWSDLTARLGRAGRVAIGADGAEAQSDEAGGPALVFRHSNHRHGGWGYAGLAAPAEERKRRALADLDLLRTSAADYERAATRQRP